MSISRPVLHNSFMGYNKIEVNDYMNKLETELTTYESKKELWDSKIGAMELEALQRSNLIAEKTDEIVRITEQQKELEEQIKELRVQLTEKEAVIDKLKTDYDELKKSYEESEHNPKRIQEAILSAKDFGQTIVDKANEDAEGIRARALADKASKEEEGKMLVLAAQQEADIAINDAKNKCLKLQSNYNQMLMDASEFKAELMGLYRRHMELLTAFPEKEVIATDIIVKEVISEDATDE